MKKRFFSVFLSIVLVLCLFPLVASAATEFPSSLEAPKNIGISVLSDDKVAVYDYSIGFSIPSSIQTINDQWTSWSASKNVAELNVYLEYDYKYNENGNWHYTSAWDQPDGALESSKLTDLGTNETVYVKPDKLTDISDQMSMLDNNTVYFRCRFATTYVDNNSGKTEKMVSPWSDTSAIGKKANAVDLKVEPPVLTKAELKKDDIGAPYFEITNQIPDSVKTLDNSGGAISVSVEYSINGGEWKVQTGVDRLIELLDVKTENVGTGNTIKIEDNTYGIRARYGYGSVYGMVDVWSPYSNIITIDSQKFERLSGQTRIETAIAISKEGWPNAATTVLLTRDDNYPDALTGAPLSKKLDAPILFTNSKTLTPETGTEIARLKPSKVIILGGTGAVSQDIEDVLKQSYVIQRIGGIDRYETAEKIAKELGFTGKVAITTGEDFHSALIVSPLAAYKGIPILLTLPGELPSFTKEALQFVAPSETTVVGGTDEVSDAVIAVLPNVKRISGSDIYQTAVAVAKNLGADTSKIFFATGKDFPDALSGSALAAKFNSPILFVNEPLSDYVKQYLMENKTITKDLRLLGGEGVISENTRTAISQILQ